jgi:hypothetical protein
MQPLRNLCTLNLAVAVTTSEQAVVFWHHDPLLVEHLMPFHRGCAFQTPLRQKRGAFSGQVRGQIQ